MYISAKYKVRADENDFPQIGQVIVGKFKGVELSTIVKEIQKVEWHNTNWKEDNQVPICVVHLVVQADEKELRMKQQRQKALSENKLVILDGGKEEE